MPFLTLNNRKFHYTSSSSPAESSTKPTKPPIPIVLIHGLGSSQNFYTPILPYLQDNCRWITFDTYGAARSPFTGQAQSIEAMARDVLAFLDHFEVRQAVIVGHSMGGIIPTYLAATAPERVRGGVCIGPVNPNPGAAGVFGKRVETVRSGGMETMANTIPHAATGAKCSSLQKAFIRELLMAQDPEGYCANCRAIEHATAPEYGLVKVPLLIIAGDEDKSAPLEGCRYIHDHVSSKEKQLEVLEGVGHWHCIEAPDDVGRLVARFCDSLT